MSRRIAAIVVVMFVIVPLFAWGTATASEMRDRASLFSGMVGWTNHQSEQSGNRVSGGSWSFDYARVGGGGQWSVGFVLRRFESDENFVQEPPTDEVRINAKRLLTALRGTFYLRQGSITPYMSMLIGVHMQTSDVFSTSSDPYSLSSQTLATGVSAGSNFFLTGGIFLRAEYTLHYFAGSTTIKNNHMHGVYGGLGFQFGGR